MFNLVRKSSAIVLLAILTLDSAMADQTHTIRASALQTKASVLSMRASALQTRASAMLMHETHAYKVERVSKHVVVTLKQAHQVLSTSDINGGQTSTLKYLVNFQSVEANGHDSRFEEILSLSNAQYHQQLADTLMLDSSLMASMGTAANVNNTVHIQKRFRDITVDAFVTAGVSGNALRAGDEAKWYQGEKGNEFIKDTPSAEASKPSEGAKPMKDSGTINVILMINRSLTPGAQAKAATILNEAKSAALAELAIPSKQSQHLATGTGTDQYIIASMLDTPLTQLDSASGHLKLGELIGSAVRTAVIEAISLQNGLERSDTRSIVHALGRFGLNQDELLIQLKEHLNQNDYDLLDKNKHSLIKEPKLVAAAYAYAALLDRIEYGTLSINIANDVLRDQATNAAMAVSERSDLWHSFRAKLKPHAKQSLNLFSQAIALGWQAKWAKN